MLGKGGKTRLCVSLHPTLLTGSILPFLKFSRDQYRRVYHTAVPQDMYYLAGETLIFVGHLPAFSVNWKDLTVSVSPYIENIGEYRRKGD